MYFAKMYLLDIQDIYFFPFVFYNWPPTYMYMNIEPKTAKATWPECLVA